MQSIGAIPNFIQGAKIKPANQINIFKTGSAILEF